MRAVYRRLGAVEAAPCAGSAPHARQEPIVFHGRDRIAAWPPVPAEAIMCRGEFPLHLTERKRRQRYVEAWRKGWVTPYAGDCEVVLDPGIERRKLRITERPVVSDAIDRPHPKVA